MTDRYGVIGHPIAHSKSPVIHRLFAEATGQDITYEAWDIAPEVLAERVRQLFAEGVRGLNVTVPHKTAVARIASRLTSRAELAGAVNTLIMHADGAIEGDNTDGAGLVNDLRQNLRLRLSGTRILILGAGGATRGIVPALFETKPREIVIANRTPEKARDLARDFACWGGFSPVSSRNSADRASIWSSTRLRRACTASCRRSRRRYSARKRCATTCPTRCMTRLS